MKKKLSNIKTNFGILYINGALVYGCHLQAVITDEKTNAFKVLEASKDESIDVKLNTIIYFNGTQLLELITSSTNFGWFSGDAKSPELPSSISESVRKQVVKDMNAFKGCTKEHLAIPEEYAELITENAVIDSTIKDMLDMSTQLAEQLEKDKRSSMSIELDAFIERYAFKEHIQLTGPRGTGKTHVASEFLRTHGCDIVQLNAHNGIESTDMLGYNIRHTDGTFVWLDGVLSQAFRIAQTTKVGLFIDEILRIPVKELSILISALTPNSSNEFVLNTNRIVNIVDGIGSSEILRIPMENLWVISTTNIGADYSVEDADLAFQDRFITFDVTTSDAKLAEILTSNNVNTLDTNIITKLSQLNSAINALVQSQELTHSMNVRHLTKVLKHTTDESEIKSYLFDFAPNVCSRKTDGTLNEVELQIYKDTIKSIF